MSLYLSSKYFYLDTLFLLLLALLVSMTSKDLTCVVFFVISPFWLYTFKTFFKHSSSLLLYLGDFLYFFSERISFNPFVLLASKRFFIPSKLGGIFSVFFWCFSSVFLSSFSLSLSCLHPLSYTLKVPESR